jgi:hypothetical protein
MGLPGRPTGARSTRFAGSVRDRVIETNRAKSSSPIDNSIACRHAVMTFDPVSRIRSQGTSHHRSRESSAIDQFQGIDELGRAAEYFWCTYMPKVLSDNPATQYMMAMADKDGKLLEAGKLYKLDVPAEMPVKQFWALTVYDRATMAFIYSDLNRTTLSSYDLDKMKKNADGGVTIYVGPKPPKGLETNWVPTAGKRPLPAMRFYGGTDALNDKTFKMPDFEVVN